MENKTIYVYSGQHIPAEKVPIELHPLVCVFNIYEKLVEFSKSDETEFKLFSNNTDVVSLIGNLSTFFGATARFYIDSEFVGENIEGLENVMKDFNRAIDFLNEKYEFHNDIKNGWNLPTNIPEDNLLSKIIFTATSDIYEKIKFIGFFDNTHHVFVATEMIVSEIKSKLLNPKRIHITGIRYWKYLD